MRTDCQFVFTRATPIYYSGDQICGHFQLTITKQLQLEAIYLTFLGIGHVEWRDKSAKTLQVEYDDTSVKHENPTYYNGTQEYHRECIQFAGHRTLLAGIYDEKFNFKIPDCMPPTCKFDYGQIVYRLILTLKRKSTFNKIFQREVCIKTQLDLSAETRLREQYTAHCGNDADAIKFTIPCTGFVPGQLIEYHLECDGEFRRQHKICLQLCQCIMYKSLQPTVKIKQIIKQIAMKTLHVSKLNEIGSLSIPLALPLTTTTQTTTCDDDWLIQCAYYLEMIIVVGKNHILQNTRIPIKLGSTAVMSTTFLDERYANCCYDNLASATNDDAADYDDLDNDDADDEESSEIFLESSFCNLLV